MDPIRITVQDSKKSTAIPAFPTQSFLKALREAGFSEPAAPCGGNGKCRKCLASISGPVVAADGSETRQATGELLLCCQWRPAGDCTVVLPERERLDIVTRGAGDIRPSGEGLGLAIDIGTTTVAAFLYDLTAGKQIAQAGDRNAQRSFGADVISRITACTSGELESLRDAIRTQISDLTDGMCAQTGRKKSDITRVVIAGNTVMEHIFDGLDPTGIGAAPFKTVSLFGDLRGADGILPGLAGEADIYICPALAGYVGGDVTAGLVASGAADAEGLCLYIDIGTNGEMGLGDKEGFLCCATAAGPAFEGAEISCGMDGSPGAVDKVTFRNDAVHVRVIGDRLAVGVCGSGLIDAAAVMLEAGAVAATGRLLSPEEAPPSVRDRLVRGPDGVMHFSLQGDVYISAQDIRELQLAKAAIRGGAETLLAMRGKTAQDVTELIIAGGFGSFMDKESALRIGLLPHVPPERIRHVGNAAGAGAVLALTREGRAKVETLAAKCAYLELSGSARFMEEYIERMAFEEADD